MPSHDAQNPVDFFTKVYELIDRFEINEDTIINKYGRGKIVGQDRFLYSLILLFTKDGRHLLDGKWEEEKIWKKYIEKCQQYYIKSNHYKSILKEPQKPIIKSIYSETGLNFLLRHPTSTYDLYSQINTITDIAIKKSIIYSTNWVSVFPGKFYYHCASKKDEVDTITFDSGFLRYLIKYRKLILNKGLGITLPEESTYNYNPKNDIGHIESNCPFDSNSLKQNKSISNNFKIVDLRKSKIKNLFAEQTDKMFAVDILLPQVSQISINTLLSLREDEYDHIIRFHRALQDFLNTTSAASSEKQIIDMLVMIDSEVRTLNNRFEKLKRLRSLKLKKLSIGVISLTICFFAPEEIVKYIIALFGVKRFSNILEFIFDSKTFYSELEESPFFIPWKLTRLSK